MTDAPGSADMAPRFLAPLAGDLAPGTVVGEYRIEGVVGRGGMGVVYAALQPIIEKKAAVKVLNAQLSADRDLVRRFLDEARAVNRIRHENIIDIFSFGQLPDGRQYFVMEYLEGATLAARLDRGDLPPASLHPILSQICDALEAAHEKQIVHRDMKPENVWIGASTRGQPRVKLLDFGIAKLLATGERSITDAGALMGTPHYMSPEQCNGRGVDHRTDIYALGVLMYRLFTGQLPIRGETYAELLTKQLTLTPEPPSRLVSMPPALERLILRCLEKDPAARPQQAADVRQALLDIFGPDGLSGSQPLWVPQSLPLSRTLALGSADTSAAPGGSREGQARSVAAVASPPAPRARGRVAIAIAGVVALAGVGAWLALRARDGRPASGAITGGPGRGVPPPAPWKGALPEPATAVNPADPAPPAAAPQRIDAAVVGPERTAVAPAAHAPTGNARPTAVKHDDDRSERTEPSMPARNGKRGHDRASSTGLVTDNPFAE